MKIDVTHEGRTTLAVTRPEAEALGYPAEAIAAAEAAAQSAAGRRAIRQEIAASAGDTESLLGTTADAAAIGVLGICVLAACIDETESWGDFKREVRTNLDSLSPDADLAVAARQFLEGVGAGAIRVPLMVKGLTQVLEEIGLRSTAVADALAEGRNAA